MLRRVVVTGVGALTSLGANAPQTWANILAGKSGLSKIEHFDLEGYHSHVASMVKHDPEHPCYFDPDTGLPSKDRRKLDPFINYGVAVANEALADAGWVADTDEKQIATGVVFGAGMGGMEVVKEATEKVMAGGPRRMSPFMIPASIINLTSGMISIHNQLRGPNHAVVTACATGTHAVGDAGRMIALGDADVMVAGGSENTVFPLGVGGFQAARALSTSYNDRPTAASRPWDKGRDGFVMGDGAGALVLEEYEHAKARGAKIYAELVGYGLSGDAYHITSPHPDGDGGYRAMSAALNRGGMNPSEVDYINAHGTSTPAGDMVEYGAVARVLGSATQTAAMSSTKSAIGHLLGAAGAVEAVFSVLSIRDQVCPPTLNLDDPEDDITMNLVPHAAQERKVDVALSNSFGFGGTNASLAFKKLT